MLGESCLSRCSPLVEGWPTLPPLRLSLPCLRTISDLELFLLSQLAWRRSLWATGRQQRKERRCGGRGSSLTLLLLPTPRHWRMAILHTCWRDHTFPEEGRGREGGRREREGGREVRENRLEKEEGEVRNFV